jgi:hypothetical protein
MHPPGCRFRGVLVETPATPEMERMPVDQESAAVAFARAHAEAWSNYDWAKAREGLAADIYVTATTTLPAARLYLFDEDDKIKAEQIAFFAEPGFRSSGWITGVWVPKTRVPVWRSTR